MQIIRNLHNLPPTNQGSVITIGNYDGIHLGHQKILRHLTQKAHELNLPSTLITFNPQPREFFAKDCVPQRLMSFREKILTLKHHDINKLLCLNFNQYLAQLSAQTFIEEILVKRLNVKYLAVGDDFALGHQRTGTLELLQEYGIKYGFQVKIFKSILLNGIRISSSAIRKYLLHGNLRASQQMLGHPYSVTGRIVHGDKRGRTLGFPTANIHLNRKIVPLAGVYAVKAFDGITDRPVNGIANLGFRPTANTHKKRLLEVYLFDFSGNLYGKIISVEFIYKLRNEKKFASFEQLKQQITQDVAEVKKYFASHPS